MAPKVEDQSHESDCWISNPLSYATNLSNTDPKFRGSIHSVRSSVWLAAESFRKIDMSLIFCAETVLGFRTGLLLSSIWLLRIRIQRSIETTLKGETESALKIWISFQPLLELTCALFNSATITGMVENGLEWAKVNLNPEGSFSPFKFDFLSTSSVEMWSELHGLLNRKWNSKQNEFSRQQKSPFCTWMTRTLLRARAGIVVANIFSVLLCARAPVCACQWQWTPDFPSFLEKHWSLRSWAFLVNTGVLILKPPP